jgi:hypothetical protein
VRYRSFLRGRNRKGIEAMSTASFCGFVEEQWGRRYVKMFLSSTIKKRGGQLLGCCVAERGSRKEKKILQGKLWERELRKDSGSTFLS